MALTERERECIEALCTHLDSRQRGDTWRIIDDSLDAKYPNERSPEAIISNGTDTVAVEVKGLRSIPLDQLKTYLGYLGQRLMPSRPGHYLLVPPLGCDLPWPRSLIETLRIGIESICHSLTPDNDGYVTVPRRSVMVRQRVDGSLLFCSHGRDPLPGISGLIQGTYYMPDEGWHHDFFTDGPKQQFREAVLDGIRRIENGEASVHLEWKEEWLIYWCDAEDSIVEVVAATQAFDVGGVVRETVWLRIAAGNEKFHRCWANRHAVLLDRHTMFADEGHVRAAFEEIVAKDYENIDDVYLFEEGVIKPIFSRS